MDNIDLEFGPLRKSTQKIDSDKILQNLTNDPAQNNILKSIPLIPIRRNSQSNQDEEIVKPLMKNTSDKRKGIEDLDTHETLKKIKLFNTKQNTHETIDEDIQFNDFKKLLLSKLNHKKLSENEPFKEPFKFLKNIRLELDRILKQAIIQKESHSCIMIGQRNSYKSFLLNGEINELYKNYKDQFITIRLNGFIHTEKDAIKSLAIQLEKQLATIHNTYRDDLSTDSISDGSLTEVFEKILRILDTSTNMNDNASMNKSKITVLFIFDEIDTFAGPVRQTLLYNLFDMVEHSRIPVCIIGTTTKLNVIETLEKRVKSRFSQRLIYMPQIENANEFSDISKELLEIKFKDSDTRDGIFVQNWNKFINEQLSSFDSPLSKYVKENYETFNSIVYFKTSLIPLVQSAKSYDELQNSFTVFEKLKSYSKNQLADSYPAKVKSLSDLELAILLASTRVSEKSRDSFSNFNLTYAEFTEMIKGLNAKIPTLAPESPVKATNDKSKPQKVINFDNTIKIWSKKDVKNVWESLITLDLLTEKGDIGMRETAMAAFYASNYQFHGTKITFDLRQYQPQITLQELRSIVPKSSMYYSWTAL
ncbi:hypothetical protein TPHA_0G00360 [Tetrapisispora phaffii CBS 4417]|uniref:Origin recognition complex subunit 4 C-terminal domain-containing protein n=1 Tax=Tetrapisispora phaffii (strain ATCC 24235 / CBS 4417 / NBRC 1672 / NRRL Y-8282 / UCD 70-5) TaxID=1071381 RepID=G8BVE5_TETPH|nr:hypothetical protein TPHA_0G00360 [Tetrapisispora phaffii CBS 4417]CCE63873.1 hypothetical protein TPHA_0G00360 [Tetrapisispora phaffii CBS 4417]